MVMKLDKVVPFGRSLKEYRLIFKLSDSDLEKKIIGIGDGPASFNAEMKAIGKHVISLDPLYMFAASEIEGQFYKVVDNIINQVKQTPDDWVWTYHKSPDHLRENRVKALCMFLEDYEAGKIERRYVIGELPKLNIKDQQFDMALCSHFLFLYSDHFDFKFHLAAILEMLRIAREVRIFPLLTLALKKSPHLESLIKELEPEGYKVKTEQVKYEIQKGANEMLRIIRA